jgi:hypothetical protein
MMRLFLVIVMTVVADVARAITTAPTSPLTSKSPTRLPSIISPTKTPTRHPSSISPTKTPTRFHEPETLDPTTTPTRLPTYTSGPTSVIPLSSCAALKPCMIISIAKTNQVMYIYPSIQINYIQVNQAKLIVVFNSTSTFTAVFKNDGQAQTAATKLVTAIAKGEAEIKL